MKNVAFHNLGCKVNSYELEYVQQKFVQKGYNIVPFDQNADIYVINTCTVTNIADRKSRQMLHQAKKRNPEALVVALGCYVQTGKEAVEKDECIDLAIGNNKKREALDIIEAYLADKGKPKTDIIDINHTDEYEEMKLARTGEHTRAYIKIQDGCNQFCSYCIIPFARGRVRSRKQEDILGEIKGLADKGYREFVLTGIHISSYGVDFQDRAVYDGRESLLLELIQMIHGLEGVERIRLGSLEPRIVTEESVKCLASMKKICPHFHLSLQSGCDETLKRMNRRYTTGEYKRGVELLRDYFELPAITTDVIVGFPGETEEEFAQTKDFLREMNLFEIHVFPYSLRKGTAAAGMECQVDGETKKTRSHELLTMTKEQSENYRRQFIGKEECVLFEETKVIEGCPYQIGHTARYVKVAKSCQDDLSGRLVRGKITGMVNGEILLME